MTLIVSLRIPDGIVISGDSLATMMGRLQGQAQVKFVCPHCKKEHEVEVEYPPTSFPATTLAFAQKVSPFLGIFGVGTFGTGMLMGKSIYFSLRQLEQKHFQSVDEGKKFNVTLAAEIIGRHFHDLLTAHIKTEGRRLDDIPPESNLLGFQVVGYDEDIAKTIVVHIGREVIYEEHKDPGCTVTGQPSVANAIFSLYSDGSQKPLFDVFSLQDAIGYAEFLIRTTASHQQYSSSMPNVGGEIDIALVTPFDNFRWIKQKELSKLLEG